MNDAGLTLAMVRAAATRLAGHAVLTPLLRPPALAARTGADVLLKVESLQRTGSFKFRGAYNRLAQLTAEQRSAGVVAWSSGNHAQGVSAAAQLLGVPATIVMPHDAPATKLAGTRAYGAEVVAYDRYTESRENIATELARARGAVLVPSYDDYDVMAGQGTCGLELVEQAAALGITLDAVLICCGGGGLAAGVGTAIRALSPSTELYTVEPAGFDDHARSLSSGRREHNAGDARSLCDALLAPTPGALTFPINQRLLNGALVVSDEAALEAMRYAYGHLHLVLEPGGAVALAALLQDALPVAGRSVGVVISGGNVDPALYARIITGDAEP